MKREVVLKLEQQNKVNYESIDEFPNSHFSNVYKEAAAMTKEILEENKKYYGETITGNDRRNQEQIYNILSFVGRRGSGKTSSMLSYAEFLRDYGRIGDSLTGEKEPFRLAEDRKLFTVLDSIEASILADNEEIFEIILARMLSKFTELDKGELLQQGDYEFKRRNLYSQFEKMYRRIEFLRRKDKYMDREGDMPLQKLKELSSTYSMKKEFLELVRNYTELVCYKELDRNGFAKKDCYIVIVIDDIDMNIRHCYEMLEQIHRFLLIPNLIILLSYESEFIKKVCEIHYISELKDLEKNQMYKGNLGDVVEPLIREYLEKMLAHEKRIYMPYLSEEMNYIMIQRDNQNIGIKKAIFLGLHERLRTVFYYNEEKQHILEPVTLRDLNNFYNELIHRPAVDFELIEGKTCEECEKKSETGIEKRLDEELEKFEKNYNWFLRELVNKFSGNDESEKRKLEEVIDSPYERKVAAAYSHLSNKSNVFEENIDYYRLIAKMVEIRNYPKGSMDAKRYVELLTVYFTVLFAYLDVQAKFAQKGFEVTGKDAYKREEEKWKERETLLKERRVNRNSDRMSNINIAKLIMGNVYDYNDPKAKKLPKLGYEENCRISIQTTRSLRDMKESLEDDKVFKSDIKEFLYFLRFTNYYDVCRKYKKIITIKEDSKGQTRIVISDDASISFDITEWVWNRERYKEIAEKCIEEVDANLCRLFDYDDESVYIQNRENIKQELMKMAEKEESDIKLLSMPDVLLNMWHKNADVEIHAAENRLEEIIQEWGKVIKESLKCVGRKDEKLEEELKDNIVLRRRIFEVIVLGYEAENKDEEISGPTG